MSLLGRRRFLVQNFMYEGAGTFGNSDSNLNLGAPEACQSVAEASKQAHIILEAVPDKLEIKSKVFSEAVLTARPGAILATNTLSIPLKNIQEAEQISISKLAMFCHLHCWTLKRLWRPRFQELAGLCPHHCGRELWGCDAERQPMLLVCPPLCNHLCHALCDCSSVSCVELACHRCTLEDLPSKDSCPLSCLSPSWR